MCGIAYRDVVESGLCNYKNFISFALEHSFKRTVPQDTSFVGMLWVWSVRRWTELTDALFWHKITFYWKFVWLIQKFTARLPGPVKGFLRRWRLASRFVA